MFTREGGVEKQMVSTENITESVRTEEGSPRTCNIISQIS